MKLNDRSPQFIMLVGLPGSGKTTYRNKHFGKEFVILSTDDIIEEIARLRNETYSQVFSSSIKDASDMVDMTFESAVASDFDVVLDQTNISRTSRKKKLSKIPKQYHKKAVVFIRSKDYIDNINNERVKIGRSIPHTILENMKSNFNVSGIEREDFDEVVFVGDAE